MTAEKPEETGMYIRQYTPGDLPKIAEMFYETVHTVNIRDYTPEQVNAWAPGSIDEERWNTTFLQHDSLLAFENDVLVGFADMDASGYLDRLYVHKDYQRRGIATALCDLLEEKVQGKTLVTHASITARPFFEQRGYTVVKEQHVVCRGVSMTNFVMEKKG